MLRFQQYIELVRTQEEHKLLEAITHAKKFLLPSKESFPREVQIAGGLLAFPPGGRPSIYSVRKPNSSPRSLLTVIRICTVRHGGKI